MELAKKVEDLKSLEGPVYHIDRQHHYAEIDKQMQTIKQMNYPIRESVEVNHNFNEIADKVNALKDLTGPCYNIDREHKFGEFEINVNYEMPNNSKKLAPVLKTVMIICPRYNI